MIQHRDAPLGHLWALEYIGWCLTHCLAVAGALELQYRLGRAHDNFERLGFRSERTQCARPARRS